MTRVMIVDDHPIISAGVQALVESTDDLEVCACAVDGETAIELARRDPPDVIVMDLSMRGMGGIAATRLIREANPDIKVLVLTWHADVARIRGALAAGATGYLLKDADHEELLDAIRAVARGESRVSELAARAMTS